MKHLNWQKQYAIDKEIHSMILCPRFDHEEVAEISDAVGNNVGVTVASEGPSSRIAKEAMEEAGWFQ